MDIHPPTLPITSWLDAVAAKQPTPGGGSVSAITGALAAAIGQMVVAYSVGRKSNSAEQNDRLNAAVHQLENARQLMLGLCAEDQAAYAAYVDAKADREAAPQAFQDAVHRGVNVPLAIAAAAEAVLRLAMELKGDTNPYLRSDLKVCGELCLATVRSASHMVRANLPDLTDAAKATQAGEQIESLLAYASEQHGSLCNS